MANSSLHENLILSFLVTNCEIYKLNEPEALHYISFYFLEPVSRRTYYNYKRKIYRICLSVYGEYEDENRKDFQFLKLPKITDFINHEQLRFLLLDMKEDLITYGLEMGIHLSDYDKLHFFPTYFINSSNHVKSVLNHSRKYLDKIKQKLNSNNINSKSRPNNATIRREYVKCGKEYCKGCRHGPYYYGYWRQRNGKLKKKYIGINK